MNCTEARARFDAYLADALPADVLVEFGSHVAGCGACRHASEQARQLAALLAEAQAPEVPDGFAERVLARANRLRGREAPPWSPRAWWLARSRSMRAAAAIMFLVGATGGIALGWTVASDPPNSVLAQAEQENDLFAGYGLGALGHAPDGSLTEVYLTLFDRWSERGK